MNSNSQNSSSPGDYPAPFIGADGTFYYPNVNPPLSYLRGLEPPTHTQFYGNLPVHPNVQTPYAQNKPLPFNGAARPAQVSGYSGTTPCQHNSNSTHANPCPHLNFSPVAPAPTGEYAREPLSRDIWYPTATLDRSKPTSTVRTQRPWRELPSRTSTTTAL